jgi:mxaJ protein
MSSRFPERSGRRLASRLPRFSLLVCALAAALPAAKTGAETRPELKICADPNNLPFSNDRLEGFENRIARLLARDLGATVRYTWWAQRRGFFRNTLKARECDVVMGIPVGLEMALATRPYYRSSYVWLARRSRAPVHSFEDPRLGKLRIGVQMVGNDYANTPPAHALMRHGLISNVVGFTLYGDYAKPNPPARIVEAVARGSVDVALVWGPLAGYFARKSKVPLTLIPAEAPPDLPDFPFAYDIAVGVRRGDTALRDRIDAALARHRTEIDRILDGYGVPRVAPSSPGGASKAAVSARMGGSP